jgi:hypothetical protein
VRGSGVHVSWHAATSRDIANLCYQSKSGFRSASLLRHPLVERNTLLGGLHNEPRVQGARRPYHEPSAVVLLGQRRRRLTTENVVHFAKVFIDRRLDVRERPLCRRADARSPVISMHRAMYCSASVDHSTR